MSIGRDALIGLACQALGRAFRASRVSLPPTDEGLRILILKPCCLGDVLLSTPVVAALRSMFPQAWLAYAVGDWAREALSGNPHLDAILDCRVRGGERPRWTDYRRTVADMRAGRFDLCVVLDRSPLITVLPYMAGIPRRVGIDSAGRGFSLTVRVPWDEEKHEAELYLDTLRAIGVGTEGFGLEFFPTEDDERWAERQSQALGARHAAGVRVALHPGGGVNPGMTLLAKRWSSAGYAALVRRVLESGGQAVLLGGETDVDVVQEVTQALGGRPDPARLLTLTGRTSLGQLGAFIRQCDLFIGNDTGPMHLAVAVGTPVVAIFGPSSPRVYGPYSPSARSVYRQVDCSPCFVKGRFATECKDYVCMKAIQVEDVWQAAVELAPGLGGGRIPSQRHRRPDGLGNPDRQEL